MGSILLLHNDCTVAHTMNDEVYKITFMVRCKRRTELRSLKLTSQSSGFYCVLAKANVEPNVKQSLTQNVEPSVKQSTKQVVKQSVKRSVKQSVKPSVKHNVKHSVTRRVKQSVKWVQVRPYETPSPLPTILLSNFSWLYRYTLRRSCNMCSDYNWSADPCTKFS